MAAVSEMPSKVAKHATSKPVKLACTACRSLRVKCDGNEPCSRCSDRECECVYVKSRRGGARYPRGKRPPSNAHTAQQRRSPSEQSFLSDVEREWESHLSSLATPGSGLLHLDDNMGMTIPGCCSLPTQPMNMTPTAAQPTYPSPQSFSLPDSESFELDAPIRVYDSDQSLLDAYYRWIHIYLPILPPPPEMPLGSYGQHHTNSMNHGASEPPNSETSSPLRLAISAVLALIPDESVPNPSRPSHVALRRKYAHQLAQRSVAMIEDESDIPQDLSPSAALAYSAAVPQRSPLHPSVPIELESVLSLCVLAIYEYAQRGNIRKMQDRAGQALVSAMTMSLHCQTNDNSLYAEARRRAWWMTYICSCQASIASCTPPTLSPNDPRFTTSYPQMANDPGVWPLYIESQQVILAATQFVISMNRFVKDPEANTVPSQEMQDLHSRIDSVVTLTNEGAHPDLSQATDPETTAARALRCMSTVKLNSARIKIHRYSAFSDLPVFSKPYCDLKQAPTNFDMGFVEDLAEWLTSCACDQPQSQSSQKAPGGPEANNLLAADSSEPFDDPCCAQSAQKKKSITLPFSKHESSLICLAAALNIAQAFEALPYPPPEASPNGATNTNNQLSNFQLSPSSLHSASTPRTLPSFACCAMQAAYALLMVCNQAWAMQTGAMPATQHPRKLLAQCEQGLYSLLGTLDNYALAFEAIRGMRDQVRESIDGFANLFAGDI